MSNDNIKTLYTFTVFSDKLVDEAVERIENEGTTEQKTITETRKVNKPVPTFFALKKPSRAEREDAEEEQAVQWSHYVSKGILPESILLKTYANAGGILSEDQRKEYTSDRAKLSTKTEELIIMKSIKETPQADINLLTSELIDLRDKIIRFEQEQSSFFENTAEAKARVKLTEYLVLHLTYTRSTNDQPWTRYFAGDTTETKRADLDKKHESEDKVFGEAYPQLLFLASFLASSGYSATTADIDEFLKTRNT